MISKELLSEVLDVEVYRIHINKNKIEWTRWDPFAETDWHGGSIDIYELQHKMKEWALSKNNLELISAITEEGAYCQIDNIVPSTIRYDINQMGTSCRTVFNSIIFDADTEPDAVFKAAEWVRQQKEN